MISAAPRWCHAAFSGNPTGITGRKHQGGDAVEQTALLELPPTAGAVRRYGKVDGMKTIAIRLEDETSDLLSLVAQLEGTSQIDQIREAITAHLERKVAEGDLTARAQEALDEVEREAEAKRKAIEQLVGDVTEATRQTKPTRRRSLSKADQATESNSPEGRTIPMGFAPVRRRQEQ